MDDLPSSPDPLGDEPPSSAHSTRRTGGSNFTNHDLSAISIPRSQIRRSSPAKHSPRKRTFELDVGDRLSPQKILVTVEAEEAMKRGINRKLFQSSSPTRSDYRRQAITTTTVPLNDEIVNDSTPRRRGRPRRTSNGTPLPKGRKRAGTPIEQASKRTRQKGDPESEISIMNDDTPKATDAGSTPKPKGRVRKTPRNVSENQIVPSSQLSNATKRRRGRPRKALMPEDVAELAEMGDQSTGNVANNSMVQPSQENSKMDISRNERSRRDMTMDDTLTLIDEIARASDDGTPTPADRSNSRMSGNIRQDIGSPRTSHQEEELYDEDLPISDAYPPLMEQHSDVGSEFDDNHDEPYSGQDTLAHASDFSMIAVESLPSFQANRSAFPTDPPDMGSETNMIINETLESLRNSIQANAAQQSPERSNGDHFTAEEDQTIMPNGSLADVSEHNLMGRPRSPRRQKSMPLNRQVLTGKTAHTDDSFSSIPDSILKAATPARLPMKPISANHQHDDTGGYDDSFSEVPEAILEAATPKPATRTVAPVEGSYLETRQPGSVNRSTGSDFGPTRLPTPDDTSSSNAGSKRAPEDEIGESSRAPTLTVPNPNIDIHSSPPIMNRPRSIDFGPPQSDREITNTPEPHHSSPQLPPSAKEVTEPPKSLEPPPIIGRTLQNVMSDRSSPEVREGSLGSPFRGSSNNESPNRTNHDISASFNARASSNYPSGHPLAQGGIVNNMSDPFVSDRNDHSQTNTLREGAFNTNERVSQHNHSLLHPSMGGSTKAMPPTSYKTSWAADDDDNQQEETSRYPDSRTLSSHNSGVFATHNSNVDQTLAENIDADEPEAGMEQEQGQEEENNDDATGYEAENTDLWDFEASRPTPRRPDSKRRASQLFDPPPRRSKILSPWRRSTRRLIYREEIASPSQIEIEENPQSETEDPPVARPKPPRPSNAHSILLEMAPSPDPDPAEVNEHEFHSPSPSPSPEQQDPLFEYEFEEQEQQQAYEHEHEQDQELEHEHENRHEEEQEQEQPEKQSAKQLTEPIDASEYSMIAQPENVPSTQKKPTPAKSGLFGGFNILSFFSSPATLPTKAPEAGQESTTRNTGNVSQPSLQRAATREMEQVPKEPPKSIWSTGLFPSIPQKDFQPSPERRTDLFSPAPPSQAKSNNTVQDTYESPSPAPSPSSGASLSPAPSPSPEPASPEPLEQSPEPTPEPASDISHEPSPEMTPEPSPERSPEVSPHPSTPDQRTYPPIAQKQNFTPRPGSSQSLFRTGPSTNQNKNHDDDLPSSDEDELQETSFLTDGTEYERVPPREKPSRWDRTLSPSKSCFRSPLKPTTPGRVVAFKPSVPSQPEAFIERQMNGSNKSNRPLLQGPPLIQPAPAPVAVPIPAATESQQANQSSSRVFTRSNTAPIAPATNMNPSYPSLPTSSVYKNNALSPAKNPAMSSLSQTEWTRNHWLRLDEMLHLRRRDPLAFQQRIPLPPRTHRKSFATLLGKEIRAQGECVPLEPWHLEVVEAFKLEVGGWDERSLAKRVFALIVGEQRRRKAREMRMGTGMGVGAA
ncbi:uncharacterized protein GGS22DRAFT_200267 [Annulohypoxylon maeteangense]|uniref:uncharacterized protein n=1 Tax=Annulohypoxylon maeteangense TaxID=1927788 RepID=UPI002007B8B8|nr:uncharacterized protein GGS22DRAFT_200267 [Annulohypoxylon maeteangense]KAI0885359.1 hypothetical protein GGS22DRAFT_200267 [Annulohypoxylon maeteangense]